MNIFASNICPYRSAFDLPDKLVVKMVLESAQLLSSACHYWNREIEDPDLNVANLYKDYPSLEPATIWAKKDIANMCWLLHHALGLAYEYEIRYDKKHKSKTKIEEVFQWYLRNFGMVRFFVDRYKIQSFFMVMPSKYRSDNPPASYKIYLQQEKSHYATWRFPSKKPRWWVAKCKHDSYRYREDRSCLII